MLKVLWYSDFLCTTGFGNVAEELLSRLCDKFDFSVLAINYFGEPYNIPSSPYYRFRNIPVYPANLHGDQLGRGRLIEFLDEGNYDLLFILQDTFNLVSLDEPLRRLRGLKGFKYVLYFPVDAPLDPLWVTKGIETADVAVAYTEYGKREAAKHSNKELRILHHGVDTKIFKPALASTKKKLKWDLFGISSDNDFVITNVNSSQPRKDIPRTIMTWLEVRKHILNAKLYLHFDAKQHNGKDLLEFITRHVPGEAKDSILYPQDFEPCSKDILREIYCASDVLVSTSLGEGWGLSITEAMACKTPVIMPRHTSCEEIIGKNQERGLLADCSNFVVLPEYDNSQIRPLTDVGSLTDCILDVYNHPQEAKNRSKAAYAWIKKYCDWDQIADLWAELFHSLAK